MAHHSQTLSGLAVPSPGLHNEAEDLNAEKDPFTYDPLPIGHIRLLSVTDVDHDGRITWSLETKKNHASLKFYALSYCWGSSETPQSIVCNGKDLPVTQSVYDVLIALEASREECMPIWIDAVCINQRDHVEKAREVSRMDMVFRRAKAVLVWLGKASDDSDLAMDRIPAVALVLAKIEHRIDEKDTSEYGLPARDDLFWPAAGNLLRRKWYNRVWTFQEAVLASSVRIMCGSRSMEWASFCHFALAIIRVNLEAIDPGPVDASELPVTLGAIYDMYWARFLKEKMVGDQMSQTGIDLAPDAGKRSFEAHEGFPFPSLLRGSQHKLCSEPRDRVYAMLSLANDDVRSKITVSYVQDLASVYLQAGKACLQDGRPAAYLNLRAGRKGMAGLPSWCSNLDPPSDESEMLYELSSSIDGADSDTGISCSHDKNQTGSLLRIRTFPNRDSIEIDGFRVDRVSGVVGPYPTRRRADYYTRQAAWLVDCLQAARATSSGQDAVDDEIPVGHVYAVTANTPQKISDGEALRQAYADVNRYVRSLVHIGTERWRPPPERTPLFEETLNRLHFTCHGRAYLTTASGRIGVGPPNSRPGDIVVLLPDTGSLYILRERPVPGMWEFIGDAFIHGLMERDVVLAERPGIFHETFVVD